MRRAKPPHGSHFEYEVVGLRVETDERTTARHGSPRSLRTGANDVYVVRGELGEVLIPAIAATS